MEVLAPVSAHMQHSTRAHIKQMSQVWNFLLFNNFPWELYFKHNYNANLLEKLILSF